MDVYPDFRDLLFEFNKNKVEFMVIGGYAMSTHGLARATKDLDLWIRPTEANVKKVLLALRSYGAPIRNLAANDLLNPKTIFQIGVAPVRIDILSSIKGVTFERAWTKRKRTKFGDQKAFALCREHLIKNKKLTGRPIDISDVAWLKENPARSRTQITARHKP
jgi:hypothetical protein